MTPQDLIGAFDAVAGAPDGVARLRELVLQLAVRGKLVAQDAADEPAVALVARAREAQAALVSTKTIPSPPAVPGDRVEAAPHDVPDAWQWAPLGHVVAVLDYMRRPVKAAERERRTAGKPASSLYPYYGATQQAGWIDDYIFDEELVLLGEDGAPFFNPDKHVAYVVSGRYWVNNHAHALRGLGVLNAYLCIVLNCATYDGLVSGTTRLKLTQGKMVRIPVPVPPLAEQHRIVARVDELMALLDDLEQAQDRRERTRVAARDSTLDALQSADSPEEVEAAWGRFAERVEELACDPADIESLRAAVLQLAVRGRLLPQRAAEGSAHDYLRQLGEMASQLGPRGGRPYNGPELSGPFAVPPSWTWCRTGQLLHSLTSGSRGWARFYSDSGPAFLRIGNLDYGTRVLDLRSVQRVSPPTGAEADRTRVQPGDVLVSITGDTGMVGVIPQSLGEAFINQHIALLRPVVEASSDYIAMALIAPSSQAQFAQSQRGIKNSLGLDDIRSVLIPLPPLPEQVRIVAFVDQLMSLLDRLQQRMTREQSWRSAFAAAAVHHLDA